ncbi:MAG: matrixin family metalloprotease, partial [Saprospiraceae bacterium]
AALDKELAAESKDCLLFRLEPIVNNTEEVSTSIKFKLFVKSETNLKLKSTSLEIKYNTNWFGNLIVQNGNIIINDQNDFNSSYSLTLLDMANDILKVSLNSNATNNLDEINANTERLICTIAVNIQNVDANMPIYLEQISYESVLYDSNNEIIRNICGAIEVQLKECSPTITSIDLKKSAGSENILEIQGSGFIHDSTQPSDAWCGLPSNQHRVKFTDINGDWVAPLEGDYLEWTDTKIKVKVPTEGYLNNSFSRTSTENNEYAATGKIRVCINDNVFACTCYDDSNIGDNENNGVLYVPFSTYTKDRESESGYNNGDCNHAHHARLISQLSNQSILFNIDGLPSQEAKNAFIRALNTWRCDIDINYSINSSFGIPVSMGTTPAGLAGKTTLFIGNCITDDQKVIFPSGIIFDINRPWHYNSSSNPSNKLDFESAALHEIGHALGLIHTSNNLNIMFPSLDLGIDKRTLTNDDLDGGNFCQDRSLITLPTGCGEELIELSGECNLPTRVKDTNDLQGYEVFPNPSQNLITIKGSNYLYNVKITSLTGVEFINIRNNSLYLNVDISSLPTGVYLLEVTEKNSKYMSKIIKL